MTSAFDGIFPVTDVDHWTLAGVVGCLLKAVHERLPAGLASYDLWDGYISPPQTIHFGWPKDGAQIVAGNNYPSSIWFTVRYLQEWVESNCVNFADQTQASGTSFGGKPAVPMWTLPNLWAAASSTLGYTATDWYRLPETGSGTLGKMQAWDRAHVRNLNEIWAMIRLLRWRTYNAVIYANGSANNANAGAGDFPGSPNRTWGQVEGTWFNQSPTGSPDYFAASSKLSTIHCSAVETKFNSSGTIRYYRSLDRNFAYPRASIQAQKAFSLDFYAIATKLTIINNSYGTDTTTFDGGGDFDGYQDVLKFQSTVAASASPTAAAWVQVTTPIGGNGATSVTDLKFDQPNDITAAGAPWNPGMYPSPIGSGQQSNDSRGYQVLYIPCVARFDVAGGYEYI